MTVLQTHKNTQTMAQDLINTKAEFDKELEAIRAKYAEAVRKQDSEITATKVMLTTREGVLKQLEANQAAELEGLPEISYQRKQVLDRYRVPIMDAKRRIAETKSRLDALTQGVTDEKVEAIVNAMHI